MSQRRFPVSSGRFPITGSGFPVLESRWTVLGNGFLIFESRFQVSQNRFQTSRSRQERMVSLIGEEIIVPLCPKISSGNPIAFCWEQDARRRGRPIPS